MHSKHIGRTLGAVTFLAAVVSAQGQSAVVQTNTPGTTYEAVLPDTNFHSIDGSLITGSITGTVPADGTGVTFSVNFSGFPDVATYGPFIYHVHAAPVPANGNCTAALAHLDPTLRGEVPPCDSGAPQTCQSGDLSGKHGNVTVQSAFTASYTDLYLSTDPTSPYFFGDKSIVLHTNNKTRLTCANFVAVLSTLPTASSSGTATPTGATPVASYTGAAARTVAGGIVGAAAAFVGVVLL